VDTDFLAELIEFLPDATFIVDSTRRVVAWNKAIEEMTGTKRSDVLGQSCHACAIPFYGRQRPLLIDVAVQGAGRMPGLYDSVTKKGNAVFAEVMADRLRKHLSAVAVSLFDVQGRFLGAIESIRDITHRRDTESTLRESEERLRSALTEKQRAEEALGKSRFDLESRSRDLSEMNTTLKVLLQQREQNQRDLEERMLSNIEAMVMPFVQKLKKCRLDASHMAYVAMIESGLTDITSSFSRKMGLQYTGLTPAEIQVANLIRTGKTTKEIGELLGVSPGAINFHRNNIRKKLGLNRKKINLVSFLSSLS
jgi:PAS domain S-box-containing protein